MSNHASFHLKQLAALCGGELRGDPALEIDGAASLAEAATGEITFYADPRYLARLRQTRASAIFVPLDFSGQTTAAQIRVANPSKAFEQVVLKLAPKPVAFTPGIHPTAVIDPTAKIGSGVSVQPHAVIEYGATIGDNAVIGAASYIGHESIIGASCLLNANLIIREQRRNGAPQIIHRRPVI